MRAPYPTIAATVLFLFTIPAAGQQSAQPEAPRTSSIGYPSVAAALAALQARNDVRIRVTDGWTIIEAEAADGLTLWSFTPVGHPAHPSAVKRTLSEKDGAFYIDMKILCQSRQAPCDQLAADFQKLNDQMRESIAHQHRAPPRN